MKRRLAELLPDIKGIPADLEVTGFSSDSRAVQAGQAFIAILPTSNDISRHGLRYVDEALARGAVAVLFDPPAPSDVKVPANAIAVPGLRARMGDFANAIHGDVTATMEVVGVTGTSGKTSTTQLIAQAWTRLGVTCGTIGTLGAGLYGKEVATGFTTPLVLETHELFVELRAAGASAVVMEVSSHALEQGRVDGVRFDIGVFTNLTRDHLDYHGDMASYGAAKARLFQRPELKVGVINIDDAFGRELAAKLPSHVRAITTSAHGDAAADIAAEALVLDARGIAFELRIGDRRQCIQSPLLGRFNADNLLAVAGVLHAQGRDFDTIVGLLPQLLPVAGRMNRLGGDGRLPLVVVDYSHKPDPLEQALDSLHAHLKGRMVCVFGCGGERDRGKRPQMARIAEDKAGLVVVTDDNPRNEDGDTIVHDIVLGFLHPEQVIVERDRRRAIDFAIGESGPDDIVLIAGKGHETYQDVRGVKHPFDDLAVARGALEMHP